MDRRRFLSTTAAFIVAGSSRLSWAQIDKPPLAKTVNVADGRFGTVIPDPYRWMENPADRELAE